MPESFTTFNYGIAISAHDTSRIGGLNTEIEFETASAIKSAVGSLAIEKAESAGHDLEAYTLTLGADHVSNGSGLLKDPANVLNNFLVTDQRGESGVCVASLRSLLHLNIVYSDCVATNALIDYLDGKDVVNNQLRQRYGVESMRLVTERLHFPGVDHQAQPFQVGASNMADFIRYYSSIWPASRQGLPAGKQQRFYFGLHALLDNSYLFGTAEDEALLPDDITWLHKTGSVFDRQPDQFYGSMVDAGLLTYGDRQLFVAAAATCMTQQPPSGLEEVMLRERFGELNLTALQPFGIKIESGIAA